MSVFRDVATWPLLLCGPMLRRVDADGVAVFVVTKAPCTVRLVVTRGGDTIAESNNVQTVSIGELLHARVCHATPVAGQALAPGALHSYDIELTDPQGTRHTLQTMQMLGDDFPLGYQPGRLPTFLMPPGTLRELRVVHASCRKPHGGGVDALWTLDRLVADPNQRPHQLFLTGDQIYADDVAVCLLSALIGVGKALIGDAHAETLPVGGIAVGDDAVRPGFTRNDWLDINARRRGNGLTSSARENHLIFFAEFCAMYMMVWSDELWARSEPAVGYTIDEIEPNLEAWYPFFTKAPSRYPPAGLDTLRTTVLGFASTVPRVRRALANTPTMMMFDDHEITDDWNLDQTWAATSRTLPVVRRIIRNGLLAYAVFQAWGNDPQRFEAGAGAELLQLLSGTRSAPSQLAQHPAAADRHLDLDLTSDPKRLEWNWAVDGPAHRVIGLDTRTHRNLVANRPPGLLTDTEIERQLGAPPAGGNRVCLVVSPAPVFGHAFIEHVVTPAAALVMGPRGPDAEAWAENSGTFLRFLSALSHFKAVVLLSGDVHYAFTQRVGYFVGDQPAARFVQLTASASKNSDAMTKFMQWDALDARPRGLLGFVDITDAELVQLRRALLGGPPAPESFLEGLWIRYAYSDGLKKVNDAPAVFKAGPWKDWGMRQVFNTQLALGRAGDCRMHIEFVRDRRDENARLAAPPVGAQPTTDATREFVKDLNEGAIGLPNLGVVRFQDAPDGHPVVIHRILVPYQDPKIPVVGVCEHSASLTPPVAAEAPKVF